MPGLSGNLRGAAFMVAAMAGFAFEDMFLKSASARIAVGEALALFGLAGTLGFCLLALRRGEVLWHPAMLSPPMILRAGFESAGRLFYTLAIALVPLSNASAILQATPLVVVAGAALFLGERVGWQRWLAIWIGFVGVLMILRPGLEGFEAASVFALLGMFGFAGRDLATRIAPRSLGTIQLGICGFAVLVPTGLALLAVTGGATIPDGGALARIGAAALAGTAAYAALMLAMRTGEISVVTPFRYSRLIFGVLLGIVVFSERPDAMTLAGGAVILAAGLYILVPRRRCGRA